MGLLLFLVIITVVWIALKRTIYKEADYEYPEFLRRLLNK